MSDEQVYIYMSLLLRDDEAKSGDRTQSFITIRALFYKHHSAERVRMKSFLLPFIGYS